MKISMSLVWAVLFLAVVLIEGVALGRPELGDTLSEVVIWIRHDGLGRWLVLPLWTWLTWHWILRPVELPMFSWRDTLALLVGIAWAFYEARPH